MKIVQALEDSMTGILKQMKMKQKKKKKDFEEFIRMILML